MNHKISSMLYSQTILERKKAKTLLLEQQQGLGKPIHSYTSGNSRIVIVGNQQYQSTQWKTFTDFLGSYIKIALGSSWGNSEIKKPYGERHPILQWYDCYGKHFNQHIRNNEDVFAIPMIGVADVYIRLAYNLYVLAHNTIKNEFSNEVQRRLIKRLKERKNFQGAYYEVYVAATLIKAGFEVTIANEGDVSRKHCDFEVVCKQSGKKYTVEAKIINRIGALGATDNATRSVGLDKSIRNKMHEALKKPSDYPRIIFIEVNLPNTEMSDKDWIQQAAQSIAKSENLTINSLEADSAYVVLTNHPSHYYLKDPQIVRSCVMVGYKMPDFGYSKFYNSLRDAHYAKLRHRDMHQLFDFLEQHYNIPSTFDGSLSCEVFYDQRPPMIGDRYTFKIDEKIIIATVISVSVNEKDKLMYMSTDQGIFEVQMPDLLLEDYRAYGVKIFGMVPNVGIKDDKSLFEIFEYLLNIYRESPKEKLLEFLSGSPDILMLNKLSQEELAIIFCERQANQLLQLRFQETKNSQ